MVEEVSDPALEISLEDAEKMDSALQVGDVAQIPVQSRNSDVSRPRTQRTLSSRKSARKRERLCLTSTLRKRRIS